MTFHRLTFRTHARATEDPARVRAALAFLTGTPAVKETGTVGFHGNPVIVLESELSDPRDVDAFWRRFREAGCADVLLDSLPLRMDESAHLYARFDKQAAFQGRVALSDEDDVIHLRAKVASHPAKKGPAMKAVQAYLRGRA